MFIQSLLTGLVAFSFFPLANLKKVEPSFRLSQLKGKKVACADSAVFEGAGFPDMDGMYAGAVFDSTYAPISLYTGPLATSLCGHVISREGAVHASATDTADYAFVLETVRIHHRVSLTATAALRKGTDGPTLARLVVDAQDKFSLGGKKRFQKGFETLRENALKNLAKDYPAEPESESESESR